MIRYHRFNSVNEAKSILKMILLIDRVNYPSQKGMSYVKSNNLINPMHSGPHLVFLHTLNVGIVRIVNTQSQKSKFNVN